MCSSILGPPTGYPNRPGSVQWSEGGTKAVASIPFYILGEKEGDINSLPPLFLFLCFWSSFYSSFFIWNVSCFFCRSTVSWLHSLGHHWQGIVAGYGGEDCVQSKRGDGGFLECGDMSLCCYGCSVNRVSFLEYVKWLCVTRFVESVLKAIHVVTWSFGMYVWIGLVLFSYVVHQPLKLIMRSWDITFKEICKFGLSDLNILHLTLTID